LISGVLVVVWALWSHTPWRELGYTRPKSWPLAITASAAGGVLFKLAMKSLVLPLLGADPINRAYHYLAHNPPALLGILLYIPFGAGFAEETFFRGYLFERLGKLLGSSLAATIAIVVITAVIFGLAHYPGQGAYGAVNALTVGLVFGALLARGTSLFSL